MVDQRTDFGGDYFGIGHYKDISTVDAYNSNPQIDAKIGDSVARANGTRGCLLEQYYFYANQDKPGAIGHWNLTYEEMRAQAIRHTLFGTRQFIFHGFYLADDVGGYELLSSSRFDFAPAVNFEPWFAHHRFFAQEISRLSSFIYQAQPIADIAMLYPLSTFWVEETDGIFGAESAVWHQNLLENGLGFDVIEEQEIRFESSNPGYLKAGKNSYRVLVLPGVKVLKNLNTVNAIHDFAKSGGSIILSGRMPEGTLDELENNAVKETFENLISHYKNVQFYPEVENSLSTINASLRTDIKDRPMIKFPQKIFGPIWSWSGLHETSHLIALFNDSPELSRMEMILPMVNVQIEKWDVLSGHKKEWLWFNEDQGTTTILVDLLPGEIACFKIDPEQKQCTPFHLINSELRVLDASKEIDQVSIEVEGITPGIFILKLNNRIETLTVPTMPVVHQLKENWTFTTPSMKKPRTINIQEGWEKQGFDEYSGEGRYSTTFGLAVLSPNWHAFDWKLTFPKIVSTAEIILNEQSIGFFIMVPL